MANDTIKEFLVSVIFGVDKNSEKRAQNAVDSFTKGIEKLAKAAAAAGVAAFITKTAAGLEKLYYQSQRIKASTNNIKAFQGAIESLGGSADEALGSMEAMAKNFRNGPGFYGMLEDLGIKTKDVNGNIKDQVELMAELGQKFAKMPHYQANSYANSIGIDERTMMAMRDGRFVEQLKRYQTLRKQMGLSDKDSKTGQEFTQQLRETSMILNLVLEKLATTMMKIILPPLKWVNNQFEALLNWFTSLPKETQETIKAFVKAGLMIVAFQAALALALPAVKGLSIAMKLLNLTFLFSPIGIVLAFAAAIALLYDDYKVWKEGGKSLVNWQNWQDEAEGAIAAVNGIKDSILGLGKTIYEFIEKHSPKFADWIGKAAVTIAAVFGDKNAQEALEVMANSKANNDVYNPRDANIATLNAPKVGGKGKSGNSNIVAGGLGSLSAKHEGKVSSANRDNIGWAYGKYQFNNETGGLSRFFADNPKYANQFKGLKSGTTAFNKKWQEIAKNDFTNFEKAQDKSAQNIWYKPAALHAEKLGFDMSNRGVQEAIFSGSIQHGGIKKLLSTVAKNNDLRKMTPQEQLKAFYKERTKYTEKHAGAGYSKRYVQELKDAMKYAEKNNILDNSLNNSNKVSRNSPSLTPKSTNTVNNVSVAPTTNITVNGVSNPQEASTIVANKVDDTYGQLTRSLQVTYG